VLWAFTPPSGVLAKYWLTHAELAGVLGGSTGLLGTAGGCIITIVVAF